MYFKQTVKLGTAYVQLCGEVLLILQVKLKSVCYFCVNLYGMAPDHFKSMKYFLKIP